MEVSHRRHWISLQVAIFYSDGGSPFWEWARHAFYFDAPMLWNFFVAIGAPTK